MSQSDPHETPLKPVNVYPPELPMKTSPIWGGSDPGYTVCIGLSREATNEEQASVMEVFEKARIYGKILELRGTTLEKVEADTHGIAAGLRRVEELAARKIRDREEAEARREQEDAAERERLRIVAESIKFE